MTYFSCIYSKPSDSSSEECILLHRRRHGSHIKILRPEGEKKKTNNPAVTRLTLRPAGGKPAREEAAPLPPPLRPALGPAPQAGGHLRHAATSARRAGDPPRPSLRETATPASPISPWPRNGSPDRGTALSVLTAHGGGGTGRLPQLLSPPLPPLRPPAGAVTWRRPQGPPRAQASLRTTIPSSAKTALPTRRGKAASPPPTHPPH